MSGWAEHRYGGGCTLDLAPGIGGQVFWSSTRGEGYVARVEGYKDKHVDSVKTGMRWVEKALRKKLTAALSALDALETETGGDK